MPMAFTDRMRRDNEIFTLTEKIRRFQAELAEASHEYERAYYESEISSCVERIRYLQNMNYFDDNTVQRIPASVSSKHTLKNSWNDVKNSGSLKEFLINLLILILECAVPVLFWGFVSYIILQMFFMK